MYSNNKMVLQLISLLKQNNIKRIVVSPGSRHFALVHSLEADSFFQLYSVVDERSAAFFALGLIQKTGECVAITCSSGTACMNYGSAIVEAYYQKLPLLVLSSDRNPQLLNQLEDQFYDQYDTFSNCTKYRGQLPIVKDATDEWYCNRIINEAIIELNHHGKGPVHINIPFIAHHADTFQTLELPTVRKISLHKADIPADEWTDYANRLKGKKVMVVCGQSVEQTPEFLEAVNAFNSNFDAVILTDKISNCHADNAILNTTVVLSILTPEERTNFCPDMVITIGGNYIFNNELKGYLQGCNIKHWQVGYEDKVCDPFRRLTDMFEMSELSFFKSITAAADYSVEGEYAMSWKKVSELPALPTPDYNELYAIGAVLNNLPKNVDLQLANSCTIRMSHFFPTDASISVNCNRGVNGIDGSMSTAVGFSAANDRPTFYITGDLSFFYDMNSLWIRHLSPKMHIMLINNGGGAIMYAPLNDEIRKTLLPHISAGHHTSAKGWVESLGFHYLSATNAVEVDEAMKTFLDVDSETPVFLEVFTEEITEDVNAIRNYFRSINRTVYTEPFKYKLRRKVRSMIPQKVVDVAKVLMK